MKGLSLDGGGLMGVGQAAILSRIPDLDKFDFIAGTSVGSIMCALIASGVKKDKYVEFFNTWGPKIFAGYSWRRFKPITPRYSDKTLNKVLKDMLPGKFGDLDRPVFITSANLNNRSLKVFNSQDEGDADMWLWEVVRMAVAAETYFVPWKGMADGAIYANNPAMTAVAGAIHTLDAKAEDIELCSIGTGDKVSNNSVGSTRGWTYFRWGIYLVQAQLEGAANKMHDFFVKQLPLKQYMRIQFERGDDWTMDNPKVVNEALRAWRPTIEDAIKAVSDF